MNAPTQIPVPTPLGKLARMTPAHVATVDWDMLSIAEARRLRELGLDEGLEVELLHRATFGKGPVAVRFGRMIVGLRRHVALAIHVVPAG